MGLDNKAVPENKAQFEPYNLAYREGNKRKLQRELVKGVRDTLQYGGRGALIDAAETYTRTMIEVDSLGKPDPSGIVGEALSQLQGVGFLKEWSFRPVEVIHKPVVTVQPAENGKTRLMARVAVKAEDPEQRRVQGTFTFETTGQEAETLAHQLWTRLVQLDRQVGYVLPKGTRED